MQHPGWLIIVQAIVAVCLADDGLTPAPSSNTGMRTKWGPWQAIDVLLKPGDLVEFSRSLGSGKAAYKHWGVYVAHVDNRPIIIHYSTPAATAEEDSWIAAWLPASLGSLNSASSVMEIMGDVRVREDLLEVVASGSQCRINNLQDIIDRPFEPQIVVKRARRKLGEQGYHLLSQNCEHFSKYMRNGVSISLQAKQAHGPLKKLYTAGKFAVALTLGDDHAIPLAMLITPRILRSTVMCLKTMTSRGRR